MKIYNNLIINTEIERKLDAIVSKNKIPNALLFHGNEGLGKFGHAIEFCNLVLTINNSNNSYYKKIKTNQHQNINYILPLPKSKTIKKNDPAIKALSNKDINNVHEQLIQKLDNPYHKIVLDKANTILINSIRDIKKKISLSVYENNYNIFVILNAEKLCYPRNESANALLKILEEPNDNNLFILITSNKSKLMDTITSRCMEIYFPNIDRKLIKDFFQKQYNTELDKIDIITNLCCSDISAGIELLDNFNEKIDNINKMIQLLFNYDLEKWQKLITKLKNKENFKYYLNLIEIFLIDLINYKKIKSKNNLRFKKFNIKIEDISNLCTIDCCYQLIHLVYELRNNMETNTYFSLLSTSFYLEFHQILSSKKMKKFSFSNYTEMFK